MNNLPSSVRKISTQDHLCDVCQVRCARYYDVMWYIHICSLKCLKEFIVRYDAEIDRFSITRLNPDDIGRSEDAM